MTTNCSTTVESWSPGSCESVEKAEFRIDVIEKQFHEAKSHFGIQASGARPWKTTFFRLGPLTGFLAMLVALSSIVISLGILVASDGAAVSSWAIEPTVYLAICTAIANLAMRYACIQGVVVAWWIRAMSGKATLRRLHHDWKSGTTLIGALTAGRNLGFLGIAMIFSTVVVMDGPLLQKSTSVITAPVQGELVILNVVMAQEVPTDYTGVWKQMMDPRLNGYYNPQYNATSPSSDGGSIPNNIFAAALPSAGARLGSHFFSDALLSAVTTTYNGACKATIRAPALAVHHCTSQQKPVDFNKAIEGKLLAVAPPLDQYAFLSSVTLVTEGQQEHIEVVSAYSTTQDCVGTLNVTVCSLVPAVGEYNLSISQNLSLLEAPAHPRIVMLANNAYVNRTIDPTFGAYPSTLGGIVDMNSQMSSSMIAAYRENGRVAYMTLAERMYIQFQYGKSDCGLTSFSDPFEYMMAYLNKAMVYAGALAATKERSFLEQRMDPGLVDQVNTTVIGTPTGDHNVFHTDYWFFFAAALVEVVCVICISPTYWKWWELGRPVSFSPLEVAKAFEAPILADIGSNSSGREIARRKGGCPIQYGCKLNSGTCHRQEDRTHLAFADPGAVVKPSAGIIPPA
jgi:hypothetical protein